MFTRFFSVSAYLLCLLSTTTKTRATDEAGLAFLAANRQEKGVVTLDDDDSGGLQYKILVNGTGMYHPTASCQCQCHYEGRLLDGHVFDSSFQRGEPLSVAPSQVIAGWTTAMQLMVAGDKWELYIPSEIGYGDRGHPPDIPGHAVLIFVMEMVAVDCDDAHRRLALKCSVVHDDDDAESSDNDSTFCNERELGYIAKIKGWTSEKVASEIVRLDKILGEGTPLKADLKEWVQRRQHLLHQISAALPAETEL